MKQDITMYTDDELSLQVNNNEGLYDLQKESFKLLLTILEENYIYTDEQLDVLKDDYNSDE